MTIGRNPDVTVCILSTMISRCHAVLKKSESGCWTIKDNKVIGLFSNDSVKVEVLPLSQSCNSYLYTIQALSLNISTHTTLLWIFSKLEVKLFQKQTEI